MIEQHDLITIRNDKSQVFTDVNPMYLCRFGKNTYTSETLTYISDHWHDEIEFLYVLDGQHDYTVNGTQIHLNAHEGIFINSKRIHCNYSKAGEYSVFLYLLIHPSHLCASPYIEQKYIKPLMAQESNDYIILRNEEGDWTKQILDSFLSMADKPASTREIGLLEHSLGAIRLIYENVDIANQVNTADPVHLNIFQDMLQFVYDHYTEKISLEDIAAAGNVGKTLCAKLFKKYVQKTPGEYLIYYRIIKSTEQLSTSNLSIADIAYSSGFSSASNYTKTFREIVGCTPIKYRNSL